MAATTSLTGGTPTGETGLFSIKHVCSLMRLNYEESSIKFKFAWVRKYPQIAHDTLGQAYFRGLQVMSVLQEENAFLTTDAGLA